MRVNLYSGLYDQPARSNLHWWAGSRFNSGVNFDYQTPLNANNWLVVGGGHIQDEDFRYLEDEKRTRLFVKYGHRSPKIEGLEASIATHIMYSDIGNSLLWEGDSLGYIPLDSSITRAYGWDFYMDPTLSYRHGPI
ncbi:MAG: hypothetical protein U5L96_01055 [Owenweeksia sp.]|nr:hypothetical protein [Owenweeksia sp.]